MRSTVGLPMRSIAFLLGALVVVMTTFMVTQRAQAKKPGSNPLTQQVTGTVQGTGDEFSGTVSIERFAVQNGQIVALGTVSGTITDAVTGDQQQITDQFTAPITISQATCEILVLDLGPLHLDLLGLVIDLDPVHLEITAEQGPGNLLGNLLCALAGLLDNTGGGGGGGPLQGIVNLLNQILSILQGL